MRNNYQSFLDRLELLFAVYMRNLPYNYLDFPMPKQVDINWGWDGFTTFKKNYGYFRFCLYKNKRRRSNIFRLRIRDSIE